MRVHTSACIYQEGQRTVCRVGSGSFATCVVSFPVNLTGAKVREEEGTETEMCPLDL